MEQVTPPPPATFLGLHVRLTDKSTLLAAIENATPTQPVRVATLNPEIVLEAHRTPALGQALTHMSHCTIDGTGLAWFLHYARNRINLPSIPPRYPGADLVSDLFERYQDGSKRFFLLGGTPEQNDRATKAIQAAYPSLAIAGHTSGGSIDPTHPVDATLLETINATDPDIVLVAFGAPRQELWIAAAATLRAPTAVGVGGSLDFYGSKKRAPQVLRSLHLEWLWRTLTERGHLKRAWRATVVFPLYAFRALSTKSK